MFIKKIKVACNKSQVFKNRPPPPPTKLVLDENCTSPKMLIVENYIAHLQG